MDACRMSRSAPQGVSLRLSTRAQDSAEEQLGCPSAFVSPKTDG